MQTQTFMTLYPFEEWILFRSSVQKRKHFGAFPIFLQKRGLAPPPKLGPSPTPWGWPGCCWPAVPSRRPRRCTAASWRPPSGSTAPSTATRWRRRATWRWCCRTSAAWRRRGASGGALEIPWKSGSYGSCMGEIWWSGDNKGILNRFQLTYVTFHWLSDGKEVSKAGMNWHVCSCMSFGLLSHVLTVDTFSFHVGWGMRTWDLRASMFPPSGSHAVRRSHCIAELLQVERHSWAGIIQTPSSGWTTSLSSWRARASWTRPESGEEKTGSHGAGLPWNLQTILTQNCSLSLPSLHPFCHLMFL